MQSELLAKYRETFNNESYKRDSGHSVIYTIAINEPFREMAQLWVASARILAGYYGDIILFTDKPFDCAFDSRVIVETAHVLSAKTSGTDISSYVSCQQNLRLEMALQYNFNKYSKIIYSDVDILFVNNLWKVVSSIPDNGVCYAREQIPATAGYYNKLFVKYHVDKYLEGKLGINSGFLGFSRNALQNFVNEWRTLLYAERKTDPKTSDQQALNWLICFPLNTYKLVEFPDGTVETPDYFVKKRKDLLPRIDPDKNNLWHFVGNLVDKNSLLHMYRDADLVLKARTEKCKFLHISDPETASFDL